MYVCVCVCFVQNALYGLFVPVESWVFSMYQICPVWFTSHRPSLHSLLLLQTHYVLLSQAVRGPTVCCSEETMPAEQDVVWGPALPSPGPFSLLSGQPHWHGHLEKAQGKQMDEKSILMGCLNALSFHIKRSSACYLILCIFIVSFTQKYLLTKLGRIYMIPIDSVSQTFPF